MDRIQKKRCACMCVSVRPDQYELINTRRQLEGPWGQEIHTWFARRHAHTPTRTLTQALLTWFSQDLTVGDMTLHTRGRIHAIVPKRQRVISETPHAHVCKVTCVLTAWPIDSRKHENLNSKWSYRQDKSIVSKTSTYCLYRCRF